MKKPLLESLTCVNSECKAHGTTVAAAYTYEVIRRFSAAIGLERLRHSARDYSHPTSLALSLCLGR